MHIPIFSSPPNSQKQANLCQQKGEAELNRNKSNDQNTSKNRDRAISNSLRRAHHA
ncbi:hypothetical protein DCAR_0830536 [Daucus carota subsp. sativus]|uniref:Uncharacterized protein n=1 Tax=Daucus carota subsp. sativus TaxID=79200 RepID=A0A175YJA0_DAUCS|nr:hypothetical protein DCAR_0830536 [Daucus carota subsp. sativus]